MNIARFKKLHRRRLRGRGAALVEAIIVSGMLMTFMASGLFLCRVYGAHHDAMGAARLAAWSRALPGCNSAVDLGTVWSQTGEQASPLDIESETTPGFFGAVSHTSGSAEQAPSGSVSGDARFNSGRYAFRARDSVACNEIIYERGDLHALVGYITSNVIPSIF